MSLELLKNQCKVIGNETENQGKKLEKAKLQMFFV